MIVIAIINCTINTDSYLRESIYNYKLLQFLAINILFIIKKLYIY